LHIYLNLRPQWLCPLRGSITKKLLCVTKQNWMTALEEKATNRCGSQREDDDCAGSDVKYGLPFLNAT
jgi:hypothetical protein